MQKSETIGALMAALSKAQAEMKNPSFDSVNPHFKSKFASLANVRDTITPALTKHGLAVTQLTGNDNDGRPCVETVLGHSSGEWIASTFTVPVAKADAHGAGSAITYARRYALMAIVGVVGDEDDDANQAVTKPAEVKRGAPKELLGKAARSADAGVDSFRTFWKALDVAERALLEPHLDGLKAQAEAAMVNA